jgi:hypothetical protein
MNNRQYLTGREPGVQAILNGYTGKSITWSAETTYVVQNTYWDEGSRYSYSAVKLGDGKRAKMPQYNPPQFGGPTVPEQPTHPGLVILEENSYGGRRHLHIYVHPDDAPRLLPPVDTVTDNERTVLTYTARLKNTYGGETNIRFREASRETKITAGEWESAKNALISRRLLNKAGAITVAGRNAIA